MCPTPIVTFVLLVLVTACLTSLVLSACTDCPYRGCHRVHDRKLNIHLVAHTHDDAGWLKTADQYYYGGNKRYTQDGVQYIIDSVIGELDADENRRFILAETLFLWRWWNDRSSYLRNKLKNFIETGRLQLVNGGWVMSDEATPHYTMLIDQMSFGIRFLRDVFGKCGIPKIAWQIDSFGHSSEQGDQFAAMGYDAVFFGRINQDEYLSRRDRREMEMVWTPFKGGRSLFTSVLYNLYQPPDGFCFDYSCADEPIVDSPRLHGFNVEERIRRFVDTAKNWASAYRTNHVILTMGGDFHYMVASSWFTNLDKIIRHVNKQYNDVNVIYSTPACYVQALNRLNISWPVKENEDFFPYSSYEKRYWTGYYTSRPNLKYMIALANNLLQVVKKMGVYSNYWSRTDEFEIERVLALVQHHDAISGTQRQHVADDYALYLDEAISRSKDVITRTYRSWGEISETKHSFCLLRNISQCYISEQRRRFIMYIFNPLTTFANVTVRLPCGQQILLAYDNHDNPILGDYMPVAAPVSAIPGRHSIARYEYVFQASNVPPIGYKTYFIQRKTSFDSTNLPSSYASTTEWSREFSSSTTGPINERLLGFDDGIRIKMNSTSGLLQYVVLNGTAWFLEQNFGYYDSNQRWHTSGAYTFAPSTRGLTRFSNPPTYTVHQGQNVIEVHQIFETWVSQVIRLHRGIQSIEFEWLVGPIDLEDTVSKEVVTSYKTQMVTNGEFYTDGNGRRWVKRRRGYRGSVLQHGGGIESNYYPVTTAAMIRDKQMSLCVITDRAQGATSPTDGSLELMIHRRLLVDDGKGVVEPLDERAHGHGIVARGKHIVQFASIPDSAYLHRKASLTMTQGPWISFMPTSRSISQWQPGEASFLRKLLPENINVVTLQKISPTSILLRLENIFDSGEDEQFSVSTDVDLKALVNRNIKTVRETTLDGISEKDCNADRLAWRHWAGNTTRSERRSELIAHRVSLRPMEIKTFILEFA